MIATHRIHMAVPAALLGQAVAMACDVGPEGAAEAGSFQVPLQGAGGAWRGMSSAADLSLIMGINAGLAKLPDLAAACAWATTTLDGACIASSIPYLVGQAVDWDEFLAAAGLSSLQDA